MRFYCLSRGACRDSWDCLRTDNDVLLYMSRDAYRRIYGYLRTSVDVILCLKMPRDKDGHIDKYT